VEVAMHICLPLVKSNNVFGQCSSGFTASLSVLMREASYSGEEVIFRTNDVCSELYLIAKSTVKIMVQKDGQQQVRT
jgi:D-arabinose 5-phosphate isomerase GutQ